jgi:hypothetical protein
MKINKTLNALVIGLATAALAQAALPPGPTVAPDSNPIFISGSTAFRSQVWQGLTDMGLSHQPGDASGNNIFTFNGTPNNNVLGGYHGGLDANLIAGPVEVYCSFDGSAQGVNECVNSTTPQNFEDVTAPSGGGVATFTHVVDYAFSDVEQDSTIYPSTPNLAEIISLGAKSTGTGQGIAVQPFLWAANSNASNLISFINNNQIVNLFTTGQCGLNFWSCSGSSSNYIYLTGRDYSSGTRITAEELTPISTSTAIVQWTVNGNVGKPGAAPNAGPWKLATLGTFYGADDGGYGSGGNVARALGAFGVPVGDTTPVVGYVSFADAVSLVDPQQSATNGFTAGTALIFDDINPILQPVPFEYNICAVEDGSYFFWSYEHFFVSSQTADSSPTGANYTYINKDFGPGLVLAVDYEISLQAPATPQTAILEENMNVYRVNDGGPITHF